MSFFPSFDSRFTQTPNVFFDEILTSEGITLNEIKLVGFLIRHTLGYNNQAAWSGVSRKRLVEQARISNGSINQTLQSSLDKGWILEYKWGSEGKEERYLFLNNDQNKRIVQALKWGCFRIDKLTNLNHNGIEQLLNQHELEVNTNIQTSTATVGDLYRDCRGTSTTAVGGTSPVTVGGTPPAAVGVDKTLSLDTKGVDRLLKTVFKDKKIKDNYDKDKEKKENDYKDVVVVVDFINLFQKAFQETISNSEAMTLIQLANSYDKDITQCIDNVIRYFKQTKQTWTTAVGSLRYEITKGWNLNAKPKKKPPVVEEVSRIPSVEETLKIIEKYRR